MAGHNPLVAEQTARDSAKTGTVLWRDLVLGAYDVRTSAGLILTGATTPLMVNSNGNSFVRWAANDAAAATFTFVLPGDYNHLIDKCYARLSLWKSTAGNLGITMGGAYNQIRAGTAIPVAAIDITAVAISDATTPSILNLDFSGASFRAKDSMTFRLTPAAHDTCVIDLYGITIRYSGGLSLFDETERYSSTGT